MSFLPEEDQEFLDSNGISYELLTERTPEGTERRAVLFPGFTFCATLKAQTNGSLSPCDRCDVLVLIPDGYATTKLDSFYTLPRLKRPDGSDPQNANNDTEVFGKKWQFWSRHLEDGDWRQGVDGLRTFLSYIRGELKKA
jgi:hypothetical protein